MHFALGFQSTHSLRSATGVSGPDHQGHGFQSTHSLRSATQPQGDAVGIENVSIHALLAECDSKAPTIKLIRSCFNPRTPCGVRLLLT